MRTLRQVAAVVLAALVVLPFPLTASADIVVEKGIYSTTLRGPFIGGAFVQDTTLVDRGTGTGASVNAIGALKITGAGAVAAESIAVRCLTAAGTAFEACGGAGGGGGASQADRSEFGDGTGAGAPIMGVVNEGGGSMPTEDQVAAVRITDRRGLHTNLRTAAGVEIGTAASPLRTDPTGSTTQPVSGTVTANQGGAPWASNVTQFGSSAVVTGTGTGGAGIPRVTVSSDSFPATQAVSGTVTTTPPANATSNVTQFGSSAVVTGTGTGGAGVPRVTVSSDSFPATQAVSGPLTDAQLRATAVPVSVASLMNTGATADADTGAGEQTVPLFVPGSPADGGALPLFTPTNPGYTSPPPGAGDNLCTGASIETTAGTNLNQCSTEPATVTMVVAKNLSTTAACVDLYNVSTSPTVGTTARKVTIPVPPASASGDVGGIVQPFGSLGLRFDTGLFASVKGLNAGDCTQATANNAPAGVKVDIVYFQ